MSLLCMWYPRDEKKQIQRLIPDSPLIALVDPHDDVSLGFSLDVRPSFSQVLDPRIKFWMFKGRGTQFGHLVWE